MKSSLVTALTAMVTAVLLFVGVFVLAEAISVKQPKLVSKKPVLPVTNVPPQAPQVTNDAKPVQKSKGVEIITITSQNSLSLRGPVTEQSVSPIQVQAMKLSRELPANATIYLVLDTPGGSVDAGNRLIETLQALPQKVKTITIFSASMGFHTAQNLDERLILPSGTLMSHRMSVRGLSGEVPGELITRVKMLQRMSEIMDTVAADRMKISLADYKELIRDEYWVTGSDAIHDKAADRIVLVRCDASLSGYETIQINALLFTFKAKVSQCPMVPGLFGLDGSGSDEATRIVKLGFEDKRAFAQEFVVPGRVEEVLK